MGKQYCRYCSFCIYGDVPYCTDHDEVLSDRKIRQENHCKDFDLSALGDVESGRQYKPRRRAQADTDYKQMTLEEM